MEETGDSAPTIQIKLITKQEKFAVPDNIYNVSNKISTTELNTLVNSLLLQENASYKVQNYDFLVNNELLPRESKFEDFIFLNKLAIEHEFIIEYIKATPSPEPLDCLMHDDWVAAVHNSQKWILSGCYDNSVHIWSSKGKHLLTMTGHSGPIKGVSWINIDSIQATFVSVGHDQTALLWEWDVEKNNAKAVYVCRGHERSVNCVHSCPPENLFVTGGWDTALKIWSADTSVTTSDVHEEEFSSSKRRKGGNGPITRVPKCTLKGHKESVSAVQWTGSEEILSSSWDHTIKLWDAEYGGLKQEIVTNKAVFNSHHSELSRLVIACGADRHVRLYDPRSNEGSIVKKTFTSHKEWVQTVNWSSTNSNLFISGSYDNVLKLWDIRCGNTPLNDMIGHDDKILCSDWSKPEIIVSGGSDSTLRLFKSN